MGFDEEYERARDWVATDLSFDVDANFNSFEVSNRYFHIPCPALAELAPYNRLLSAFSVAYLRPTI